MRLHPVAVGIIERFNIHEAVPLLTPKFRATAFLFPPADDFFPRPVNSFLPSFLLSFLFHFSFSFFSIARTRAAKRRSCKLIKRNGTKQKVNKVKQLPSAPFGSELRKRFSDFSLIEKFERQSFSSGVRGGGGREKRKGKRNDGKY